MASDFLPQELPELSDEELQEKAAAFFENLSEASQRKQAN